MLGTVAEVHGDEGGLVWPKSIAPFAVHLVELGNVNDPTVRAEAQKLYDELTDAGAEVLWDDRDIRAGEKFAESDLLGIPLRVVVSTKTIASGKLEVKSRKEGVVSLIDRDEVTNILNSVF